jgi:hypothetical protein
MIRQRTPTRRFKAIAASAVVVCGLLVLLGNIDGSVVQLSCSLCTTANRSTELLESAVLSAALKVLQAFVFHRQLLVQSLVHMLVSLWLLLLVIAAALLLRGQRRG